MRLPTLSLLRKKYMFSFQNILMIQSELGDLRNIKFILTVELAANTTKMNVASRIFDISL